MSLDRKGGESSLSKFLSDAMAGAKRLPGGGISVNFPGATLSVNPSQLKRSTFSDYERLLLNPNALPADVEKAVAGFKQLWQEEHRMDAFFAYIAGLLQDPKNKETALF